MDESAKISERFSDLMKTQNNLSSAETANFKTLLKHKQSITNNHTTPLYPISKLILLNSFTIQSVACMEQKHGAECPHFVRVHTSSVLTKRCR